MSSTLESVREILVRKNADMETAFGAPWRPIMDWVSRDHRTANGYQRLPLSVSFYHEKPAFILDDSSSLTAYVFDATGRCVGEKYCGTYESQLNVSPNNAASGGEVPPPGFMVIYIRTHWNGRGMSWRMYVVSAPPIPMLPAPPPPALPGRIS